MKNTLLVILVSLTLLADSRTKEPAMVSSFKKTIWQDIDGKKKSLSSIIKDNGLIVISYTECKTLCPTITSIVKSISEKLELKGKKYEVIFLSIDPEADSLENRQNHFKKFDIVGPRWHFLTTKFKTTQDVVKSLGFSFGEKRNNEHTMHTSQVALVNKKGHILKKIDLSSDDVDSFVNEL